MPEILLSEYLLCGFATGEIYFHNHRTNETVWDRPTDWPLGMAQQMGGMGM
jgi:hypothetical protein